MKLRQSNADETDIKYDICRLSFRHSDSQRRQDCFLTSKQSTSNEVELLALPMLIWSKERGLEGSIDFVQITLALLWATFMPGLPRTTKKSMP